MKVKRYDIDVDHHADCWCSIEEDSDGDYVKYEDYERLRNRLEGGEPMSDLEMFNKWWRTAEFDGSAIEAAHAAWVASREQAVPVINQRDKLVADAHRKAREGQAHMLVPPRFIVAMDDAIKELTGE